MQGEGPLLSAPVSLDYAVGVAFANVGGIGAVTPVDLDGAVGTYESEYVAAIDGEQHFANL